MMSSFAGKIALVTGAASGVGLACARILKERGATVVMTDQREESVVAAARMLGERCSGLAHDVSDERSWGTAMDQVLRTHGQLDVLVNAAGIAHAATVEDLDVEGWRRVQAINSESVYLGCHFAVEAMRENGGAIVNVSSAAAWRPPVKSLAYAVSKASIDIITRHTAVHCGEAGYSIRCNAVLPGPIRTPMGDTVIEGFLARGLAADRAAAERMFADRSAIGRIAEPEEIARAIVFLASDEASYITGVELAVDGGMCAR